MKFSSSLGAGFMRQSIIEEVRVIMISETRAQVLGSSFQREWKANSEYEFEYTRWLLTSLGLWSKLSKTTRLEEICAILIIALFIWAVIVTVIPCTMFSIIKIKTMEERLAFIGPLGFYFVNNLKYFFIIHHADLMKKCINHMRGDWMEAVGESEQTVMLESADVGRKLTQVCALFMYSGAIFFQAEKMIEPAPVNSLNVTIRRHIVPRYDYVVDSQISPVYELAYGTHLMYAIFLYTIEVAVCNLATVFVGHICGQVQVMRLKLEQLEQCAIYNNHKGIDDFIASVIQCHVKMLTFTGNVRTALSEICLVEAIYSVGIICWLEFFCLKGLNDSDILSIITYSTLFLSLSINIFILCYIGEILKNQSESVAELTYRIDWCQIPQRKLSPFILLISMARYPRNITAGGMMEMTLGSFGNVLKTSFVYFQMLRTVTDPDI